MLFEATTDDATTLGFWLNWRVLLCATWVFASFFLALWMIWTYEIKDRLGHSSQETLQDRNKLQSCEAWRPCIKRIHPLWLLAYRVLAFGLMLTSLIAKALVNGASMFYYYTHLILFYYFTCYFTSKSCIKRIHPLWLLAYRVLAFGLMLTSLIAKALVNGASMFYYYTQWTFTLLMIYFACGSVVSIYGVFLCNKPRSEGLNARLYENVMEEGQPVPLLSGRPSNLVGGSIVSHSNEQSFSSTAGNILIYIFEVLFQINAGAVILTDCTYWFVIFPFLTIKDYNLSFMTVNMHTVNLVLLLGETALNSLTLQVHRISFFILWTGIYVIFLWIIHTFVPIGWPYPFLDLSATYAPLWYLLMGLMHIPSYGIFMLITKLKHKLMLKWFPQSYLW